MDLKFQDFAHLPQKYANLDFIPNIRKSRFIAGFVERLQEPSGRKLKKLDSDKRSICGESYEKIATSLDRWVLSEGKLKKIDSDKRSIGVFLKNAKLELLCEACCLFSWELFCALLTRAVRVSSPLSGEIARTMRVTINRTYELFFL